MKKSELTFTLIKIPLDATMIVLAGFLSYLIRFSTQLTSLRPALFVWAFKDYMLAVVITALVWLVIFAVLGKYRFVQQKKLLDILLEMIVAVSVGTVVVIIFSFAIRELFSSRFIIVAAWLLSIILLTAYRTILNILQRRLYRYGYGVHRIVLIGSNGVCQHLKKSILENPLVGYQIISVLPEINASTEKLLESLIASPGVDEIIHCDPKIKHDEASKLIEFCQEYKIDFRFVPDTFETRATNIDVKSLLGVPIISIRNTPLDGWGRIMKRFLDIIISLLALIILSPLFLGVAFLIKLDNKNPGPIIFKSPRVNHNGRFNLYKFRSMIDEAHEMKKKLLPLNERSGPLFKLKNDPRVTKIGAFLRRTSIDEFPQFWNVLKGEISLVGPRPHEPEEVAQYKKHHRRLLSIKPGITGMAQISGRSDLDFEEEARLDIYYIENWSPRLDIQILYKTFFVIISRKSAA